MPLWLSVVLTVTVVVLGVSGVGYLINRNNEIEAPLAAAPKTRNHED